MLGIDNGDGSSGTRAFGGKVMLLLCVCVCGLAVQ